MAEATGRTDARATLRYLRASPQKVRLVVDLLRGKQVTEALSILKFTNRMVAAPLQKLLKSAVANAEQSEVGDLEDLVVAEAYVDGGPSLKRIRPAPMGRAYRFVHRTSHVTFRVARTDARPHPKRGKAKPAASASARGAAPPATKSAKAAPAPKKKAAASKAGAGSRKK